MIEYCHLNVVHLDHFWKSSGHHKYLCCHGKEELNASWQNGKYLLRTSTYQYLLVPTSTYQYLLVVCLSISIHVYTKIQIYFIHTCICTYLHAIFNSYNHTYTETFICYILIDQYMNTFTCMDTLLHLYLCILFMHVYMLLHR